ncbi:hypothetical protein CGZ80_14690 [Rhodopirellula sp. MGV]|nr:hypothetical protein CGZ80_14690 [Rhodopirellula sp. MGV]
MSPPRPPRPPNPPAPPGPPCPRPPRPKPPRSGISNGLPLSSSNCFFCSLVSRPMTLSSRSFCAVCIFSRMLSRSPDWNISRMLANSS